MSPIATRSSVYETPTRNRHLSRLQVPSSATKTLPRTHRHREPSGEDGAKDKNAETMGVYLRLKPVSKEGKSIFKIDDQQVRAVPPDGSISKIYKFTHIFDFSSQSEVFEKVAKPVAEEFIVTAKDGLIFTYGNTGSGKTFTMEGNRKDPGIIYRTIDFLFNSIGSQQAVQNIIGKKDPKFNGYCVLNQRHLYPELHMDPLDTPTGISKYPSAAEWHNRTKETSSVSVDPNIYFAVFISLVELYQKQIHDLFREVLDLRSEKQFRLDKQDSRKRPEILEDRDRNMRYLANAVEFEVKSADEAVEYYRRGIQLRKTNATKLNQESSRGHCVLNLKLVQVQKSYDGEFDPATLVTSQLSLVDLAGSERAKRTGATGATLGEAAKINNSLGTLRRCIEGLRNREVHLNIPYRDDNLTRLFQSYLEGRGTVSMILCVNPTAEDYNENSEAMKFGVHTQDVAVDYASPPKIIKRSKSRFLDNPDLAVYELDMDMEGGQFFDKVISFIEKRRLRLKIDSEAVLAAQAEVRKSIEKTIKETATLKQASETQAKDLRINKDQIKRLVDETDERLGEIKDLKRLVDNQQKEITKKNRIIQKLQSKENLLAKEIEDGRFQNENLRREVETLLKTEELRNESRRSIIQTLNKMAPSHWANLTPTAPKIGPLQSSSPVDIPNPSTTETTESHSPPATTNTSSEAIEFQERAPRSRNKSPTIVRTNSGVPVVNPRHNRSYSCPNGKVLMHVPKGTIETGTIFKAKIRNGRPVKNLRSSDVLQKDAAAYSVIHQDADDNGDVETSVYKGKIIPTVCGGAQVILDDIETMRQISPKRKRPARDAQYTH